MAEEDIYGNKRKYEFFVEHYNEFILIPEERVHRNRTGRAKYVCRNEINIKYFPKLFRSFESKDLSYVRRNRLLKTFKMICHVAIKDLATADREDINEIVAFSHTVNNSIKSKHDFAVDIKYLWKILYPVKDEKEHIDETIVPYPVRHLSGKIDKSREKRRDDKFSLEEFEKIVSSFSGDLRIQAYLTLAFESLGRPQELLYVRLKDVEFNDNYAKIWISEHGKEGTGFLQCIDSFKYVANWYNQHPLKHNRTSFLFINMGNPRKYQQMNPTNINKLIKSRLKLLGIEKKITCYSLKRNGVTYRRLRGDSDVQIQHAARWTSTKQLRTYDLSNADDTFKQELAKRGLIKDDRYSSFQTTKKCSFCDTLNGITDELCVKCKRPLDRTRILKE